VVRGREVILGSVMVIPPEDRKRLEDMGEARVRLEFNTSAFGKSSLQIFAAEWLAELDEVARKRTEAQRLKDEAFQAEQRAVGQSTLKAAWIAAGAAIIAVVIGILTWIFPLH
jgi:3'-phosphoadenosine 5'-phosphosulfate (PAPS) 3'-phosphatase